MLKREHATGLVESGEDVNEKEKNMGKLKQTGKANA